MSSLVDRHNVRSLALNIVVKPGPTVELRRLNQGRRRVLKSGPAEEIIECRRHERGESTREGLGENFEF